MTFRFEILYRSKKSAARLGRIHTPHGTIETPNFVAVGTNGTVKALDNDMVRSIGLELMFCNTYHLLLQPGMDVIEKAGGLHKFVGRSMPMMTDSGGFQVFSLLYGSVADELKSRGQTVRGKMVLRIDEEGVLFRSYRNGGKVLLTPEISVDAQKKMGADIMIPFDELPPYHIDAKKLEAALDRTHRWEKRSLEHHLKNPTSQAMYGVIHGGTCPLLRKKSSVYLSGLCFDGFSIGGSFGKTKKEMLGMLHATMPYLPKEKPRHLLGIGDVHSLERCVPLGIDTFDSSYPTKAARHGLLLTEEGGSKIQRSKYKTHFSSIEKSCDCYTCQRFTLAYLHHLFKAKELTFFPLASVHNLHFMVRLMQNYREKIAKDLL